MSQFRHGGAQQGVVRGVRRGSDEDAVGDATEPFACHAREFVVGGLRHKGVEHLVGDESGQVGPTVVPNEPTRKFVLTVDGTDCPGAVAGPAVTSPVNCAMDEVTKVV